MQKKGLEGFISHLQTTSVLFMWSRVHRFLYFTYMRVSFSSLSSKKVLKSLKVVLLLWLTSAIRTGTNDGSSLNLARNLSFRSDLPGQAVLFKPWKFASARWMKTYAHRCTHTHTEHCSFYAYLLDLGDFLLYIFSFLSLFITNTVQQTVGSNH